jgi:hypothetical protein
VFLKMEKIVQMSKTVPAPADPRAKKPVPRKCQTQRIFLLSPANVAGIRAGLVMDENGNSEWARRIRRGSVPLGELFSFMSGLYFRGKLAYARAFAVTPPCLAGAFVITSSGGLVPPDTLVTIERLREISRATIDPRDERYRMPLVRDAQALLESMGVVCEVVLLGSIATPKYIDPLLDVFGEKLMFPAAFVGRGDMSRGGLMLRCVQSGEQLQYVPVLNAVRNGRKPPKLERLSCKLYS